MICRKSFKGSSLALAMMTLCILATASPLLAQCQARISTVPVPGSFGDAGATCVAAVLVDLGNGTVVDRANHLLWDKQVASLGGNVSDYENYCSQLLLGGQTGWYLPDVAQLQTLLPPGACQAVMDGCGSGSPDYPGFNGIMWSSSGVSPESYYCPGYGCPYYGWLVATGLGTDFGILTYVPLTPPRKRVDAGTYADSSSVRCVHGGLKLAITLDAVNPVKVPAGAGLSMNSIFTQAHLLLKLTDYVYPVSGVLLALRSDRPTLDQFAGPTRNTGVDGSAEAYVQTHDQTSNSTIDSTTPLLWTDPKGVVTWLPARYVTPFYTTCYRTDLESDFTGPFIAATKWSWCNTTPTSRTYRAAFMKDIQTQGSGVSVLNETIQYLTSRSCYYIAGCPTTSTGVCATVGVTTAVDNKVSPVIPMGASIDVDTLGGRVAQDTGSRKSLVGYHIDIYNGLGTAACNGWSNPNLGVTFVHY